VQLRAGTNGLTAERLLEFVRVAGDDGDAVVVNAQREETMNALRRFAAFVRSRLICVMIPGVFVRGVLVRAPAVVSLRLRDVR